jgi:hypothetical protein
MKRNLRALAIAALLCGLAANGFGVWMYYRARTQADAGMKLHQEALRLYDQSDTVKGTPEENRLIEEGRQLEQSGNETLSAARSTRLWAMTSSIGGIALILASIAMMIAHVRTKEADSSS